MITFTSGNTTYQTFDNGVTFRKKVGIKYVDVRNEDGHAKASAAFAEHRTPRGIHVECASTDAGQRDAQIAQYFARQS